MSYRNFSTIYVMSKIPAASEVDTSGFQNLLELYGLCKELKSYGESMNMNIGAKTLVLKG